MGRLVRTLALAATLACAAAQGDAPTFVDLEPLLQARCAMCHGAGAASAGLRLDGVEALLAGGARGPVVVPGDPEGSELVRRLRGTSLPRMPLTGPPYLSDAEVDLIVRWIAAGAPAVAAGSPTPAGDGAAPPTAPGASEPTPTTADATTADADGPITYADVAPILVAHCVRCHAAVGVMGPPPEGYRLDSYAEALSTDDRARIVPFAPDASELVRRIRGHARPSMPLGGSLGDAEVALLVAWIETGARAADGTPAPTPTGARLRLHGTWRADGTLDGLPLALAGARIDDDARRSAYVEVRAVVGADGAILVERLRGR